jgi:chromosome segregation ATPase
MLKELNNKLVSGGQQLQEKEAEQLAAQREYQKKIKEQRRKAEKLREEKIANENALISANVQFKSMEEELKATREYMDRQKAKFENAASEIRDLKKEHNDEKEDLMI